MEQWLRYPLLLIISCLFVHFYMTPPLDCLSPRFRSEAAWLLSCLLAGMMLTLAFAPFEQSYLALLACGLAYCSWREASLKQAFFRGLLFGLGLFGAGVSWVSVSIHDYGGSSIFGAALLTLLFVSFWALFPAITAVGFNYLSKTPQPSIMSAFSFAVVWVLLEYFRGEWLLNGFPWLQVAYSQLDGVLAGYIPVIWIYGAGFLLLFSVALVVEIIKKPTKIAVLSLLLVGTTGAALQSVDWTGSLGDKLKVSLVQGNVPQDKKWQAEVRVKTLRRYRQLAELHADSDLIIWPETAIPAYQYQVEDFYLKPLRQWAEQTNTTLVVGLPDRNPKTRENFNKVLALGKAAGDYKKQHLLPFGEYLPLQPVSGWVLDALGLHLGRFTPGASDQTLLRVGDYPFAMSICYEDAFASVFLPALPDATFLVNVTNDAWFGRSIEAAQHMQIARARALETGRYMLRATNTGITGVIDPKGKIVAQAPAFKEAVLNYRFEPYGGMTPFARLGNENVVAGLLGLLLIAVSYRKR